MIILHFGNYKMFDILFFYACLRSQINNEFINESFLYVIGRVKVPFLGILKNYTKFWCFLFF